ncbi:Hypothetical protein CINCED_3A008566 [Cinara cedri]|uniref:Uncharacterized protein n=1 Tax=Cinara cedri TaxID=506608 RepID=A0A5E4NHP4_9HEMI|nr:Hypothetical protein CINCED_3A008566 [Cinara cedri]
MQKEEKVLSKQFEKLTFVKNQSTTLIFHTAYYIAKFNRPFNDHFNLLQLQQLNGIKIGTTLHSRWDVYHWVASSLRAVKVIWKMFEALCNHFSSASFDTNRNGKTRAKYIGLRKRLVSPEFPLDFGLMCDCLNELSVLSNILQKRSVTLIQAQQHINRSVRVFISFKDLNGDYMTKETVTLNDMSFKNIKLEKKLLIRYTNHGYNIRYGEYKINQLCKRFQLNKNDAINGLRQKIEDQNISFKNVMPELLTIQHMASLMFININGPPLEQLEPETYVSSWLLNHKTADDTRTKKNVIKEPKTAEEKKSLWKIL